MTSDVHPPAGFAATLPLGLDTLPSSSALVAKPSSERALRIFARGFNAVEQRLLEGTVRLSQRRSPRLELVSEADAKSADLVLIDGSDQPTVAWFSAHRWLADKATILVDSPVAQPGQTLLRRPVQWSTLPMVLARTLEQFSGSAKR